jgi:hypothetical protein
MDINALKFFCAQHNPELDHPFSSGGYTYATDGHILVRVSKVAGVTAEVPFPVVSRVPFDHDQIVDWLTLPSVNFYQSRCEDCSGSGFVVVCDECDGSGEISYWSGFHDYFWECKTCDGCGVKPAKKKDTGSNLCQHCHGTGCSMKAEAVDVGRNNSDGMNKALIYRIKNLPNIKFSTFGQDGSPFRFKFDGGVGLLMPMRMNK